LRGKKQVNLRGTPNTHASVSSKSSEIDLDLLFGVLDASGEELVVGHGGFGGFGKHLEHED
jgi:hypothetical protein